MVYSQPHRSSNTRISNFTDTISTIYYSLFLFQWKHWHSWQHLKPRTRAQNSGWFLKVYHMFLLEVTHLYNVPTLPNLEPWQLKVCGSLFMKPRISIRRPESCNSPTNCFSTAWSVSAIQCVDGPTGSGVLSYPTSLLSCSKWHIEPEKPSM